MRPACTFVVSAMLLTASFCFTPHAHSLSSSGSGVASEDAAIPALIAEQAAAWNAGDAHAFSAGVAEDVAFVNVMGTSFRGKPAFEEQHARIFASIYKGSHLALQIDRTKMLSPEIAYIELSIELTGYHGMPPGIPTPPDGVMRTHMLQVLKKEGGEWLVEAFYNINILPADGPPPIAK